MCGGRIKIKTKKKCAKTTIKLRVENAHFYTYNTF